MAKPRNDVPPGGDAGGIFDKDNRPTIFHDQVPPITPAEAKAAVAELKGEERPTGPKPDGPKTTRGMNPVLKAADAVWKELKDLQPAERRWVWEFALTQFPELKEPR